MLGQDREREGEGEREVEIAREKERRMVGSLGEVNRWGTMCVQYAGFSQGIDGLPRHCRDDVDWPRRQALQVVEDFCLRDCRARIAD